MFLFLRNKSSIAPFVFSPWGSATKIPKAPRAKLWDFREPPVDELGFIQSPNGCGSSFRLYLDLSCVEVSKDIKQYVHLHHSYIYRHIINAYKCNIFHTMTNNSNSFRLQNHWVHQARSSPSPQLSF